MPVKRILHVVSAMNRGGTETLLMNVYRHIDRTKIQFDFISHRLEKCDYDDEIEMLGGKIYRISSLGRKGPYAYIKSIKEILSQNSYVAIHSHTDYQSGFSAFAAKLSGVQKIVCHAHTNRMQKDGRLVNYVIMPLLRSLIKYSATNYCACSIEAAQFLFGQKEIDKVRILKNVIDVDKYMQIKDVYGTELRNELKLPNDVKVLGHVGNLSKVKNHGFILKILKTLIDNGLNVVAVFAGDGPLRKQLEEQSKFLGIREYVHFLGVRKDIPKLMKAFDVFVFPSVYEGFGIVTLEAQCAGTPCIASDTVPRSTDLGLGLMKYLSLNDDPQVWANEVNKALKHNRPDKLRIKEQFLKSGFNISDSVPNWLALYGITG